MTGTWKVPEEARSDTFGRPILYAHLSMIILQLRSSLIETKTSSAVSVQESMKRYSPCILSTSLKMILDL